MKSVPSSRHLSRREFITASAAAWTASNLPALGVEPEPIIDIHQHTIYHGRTDEQLIAHQRAMGVTQTILLPAGRPMKRPSTHEGKSNGLAAGAGGNETCLVIARKYPKEFFFGANEVTDLPEAREEIEKYLKLGAVVIGEQKFNVEADSKESEIVYTLAGEYNVPVLLHFQHETYNKSFERFGKVLEKFPKVNFIGHAQTWWANIDKNHDTKLGLYPKGKVTAGGLTDRYLSDYPNMYADTSAGSGLNAFNRDEDQMRGFLERHQEKILYGSDCADAEGSGSKCTGAGLIVAIRRLAPSKEIERKILYANSKKLFRI